MSGTIEIQLKVSEELNERLKRVEEMLEMLCAVVIVPQDKACDLAGVHRNTAREKVKKGEVQPLSTNTSKRNYYTLKEVPNLKPVRRPSKAKAK